MCRRTFRCRTVVLFVLTVTSLAVVSPKGTANEIGLIERYALSNDRQAILDQLIPGSEEYYFYHCLHAQVTGQLPQAEAMLRRWEQDRQARHSRLIQGVRDRQRLLAYQDNPEQTLQYFRNRLGVPLSHSVPVMRGERLYNDRFDQKLIEVDRVVEEALRTDQHLTRDGLRHLGKRFLAKRTAGLSVNLRWLLERVDGPWMDHLDQLVIQELRTRRPQDRRFGNLSAHRFLTHSQLKRVAREVPEVAHSEPMIAESLLRLRANDDIDILQQADQRHAYLVRADAYVSKLPAAANSLKASVLYRLLEADLSIGKPQRDRFLRYLQLPRHSSLLIRPRQSRNGPLANLRQDHSDIALVPPIGDELPLVRKYLERFLVDAPSTDPYSRWIPSEYLKTVFAETKLLSGIGPSDRWYAQLSPPTRQHLKDRVELTLAETNPPRHDPKRISQLIVDVKNIKELLVRVYELNTHAYYRTHRKRVNTDIDLDGLAPSHEFPVRYAHPSIQRHREFIDLPQIKGRGVWVVDILGGGLRTRALIRRGALQWSTQQTVNGMRFTALDENRDPISSARMIIGGQQLDANPSGQIDIPLSDKPSNRNAILMDNRLAVPVSVSHLAEDYRLRVAMLVSRQQLLPGRMANLVLRPRLEMSGRPIASSMLKNPVLTITAKDIDGIESSKRFKKIVLSDDSEVVVSFRVPARLLQLSATLSGEITKVATRRIQKLVASDQWNVNSTNQSSQIIDGYLARDGENWVIETRGKNGEAVPKTVVHLELTSRFRARPVQVNLQSDDQGQVHLGALINVDRIDYRVSGAPKRSRSLVLDRVTWPTQLHAAAGHRIHLPLPNENTRVSDGYRLLEMRANRPMIDRTDRLQVDAGQLVIDKLSAGNYWLLDHRFRRTVSIAISSGPKHQQILAGKVRQLEVRRRDPLGIASIKRNKKGIAIQLSGKAPLARVHLIASRYLPETSPEQMLHLSEHPLAVRRVVTQTNGYASDLRLGEEYQYVLRRQQARKFPGVMLPQPSLLLNPWDTETTENKSQIASGGQTPPPTSLLQESDGMSKGMSRHRKRSKQSVWSTFDFIDRGAVIVANLIPDEKGRVDVSNETLGDNQLIHVLVVDPVQLIQRTVQTKLPKLHPRDLRLAKSLDASENLAFERAVLIASQERPLDIKTLGSARFQLYQSISDLFQLYATIVEDQRFNEFRTLGRWDALEISEKREFYGRMACHEIHLFLRQYDNAFFQSEILPYLRNKKQPQLVDDWLFGKDLSSWAHRSRYRYLNAFEKGVLARSVPEVRDSILRELREKESLLPIRPDQLSRLIDFGLARNQLSKPQRTNNGLAIPREDANGQHRSAFDEEVAVESRSEMPEAFADKEMKPADRDRKAIQKKRGGADAMFGTRESGASRTARFFQHLDMTRQWAENQWDRTRMNDATEQLIPIDPFWRDWAAADSQASFVSPHLLRPTSNRHAALTALAFSGLPLQADGIAFPEDPEVPFSPPHPVIVVTKRLTKLTPNQGETTLLVGQRFEALNEPSRRPDDTRPIQIAPKEYLVQQGYKGLIVVTNPTPQPRKIDILWQIPSGSLPLEGNRMTDSQTVSLAPFAIHTIRYSFYFPEPGQYSHYPVCVSDKGRVVARGDMRSFTVVEASTHTDETSWRSIARRGDAKAIANHLNQANLHRLDLDAILHRLRDRTIYDVVIGSLEQARRWDPRVWGYAILHNDLPRLQDFFANRNDLVANAGPVLRSKLLTIEPVSSKRYEHLEYAPLVRARIHSLREKPEILNDRFLNQYKQLMKIIAYQQHPTPAQRLALTYYLLIQNRIELALETFSEIADDSSLLPLQKDYMAACLAMHQGDYTTALQIAERHIDHVVPRWKHRFGEIAKQIQQRHSISLVQNGSKAGNEGKGVDSQAADLAILDRQQRQAEAASLAPGVNLAVDGNRLKISYRNTQDVMLHFYKVDLELLFSKTPFGQNDLAHMASVRPGHSERIPVKQSEGKAKYTIGEPLSRNTLLIEAVSGSVRSTALYYGGQLDTYVAEGFGQLQTKDSKTRQPVVGAYVKVYAKHSDGSVRFYKDGYTDLRGRFDYASLSTTDLATAKSLAILVLDPKRGASLHETKPPTR